LDHHRGRTADGDAVIAVIRNGIMAIDPFISLASNIWMPEAPLKAMTLSSIRGQLRTVMIPVS